MKEFLKDILSNIVANLATTAITGIPAALVLVSSTIGIVIKQTKGLAVPLYSWILLGISLIVGIINVIVVIVYIIKKSKRPVFPVISSDVRYEKAITELFFKTRENILCSREVKFEVLCEKLEKITKQFTWTGSGYKCTKLVKSLGEYVLIDGERKHPPQSYEVRFDSVKRAKDKVSYKTCTEVEDDDHVMKPFLSHQIKAQTDYLELRVTAPIGLLKNVRFAEYADTAAEVELSRPVALEGKNIGNLETYEYQVKSPNLLYCYRIEWEF